DHIAIYCAQHRIDVDIAQAVPPPKVRAISTTPSSSAIQTFPLFDEGLSVEQVAERLGRAPSTTYGYLESYIHQRRVTDPSRWISGREFAEIQSAVEQTGSEKLKPIHEALGGRIAYERIRIAIACLSNQTAGV